MLSQAGVLHFSKLSSSFKHLDHNLHVGSIWALNEKNGLEFVWSRRIKNESFFAY